MNHLNPVPHGFTDPGLHEQWMDSAEKRLNISREELIKLIGNHYTNGVHNQGK